ncbi:MAG: hypothetical protein WCE80_10015, partial [Acidimicrobiia bacterium]
MPPARRECLWTTVAESDPGCGGGYSGMSQTATPESIAMTSRLALTAGGATPSGVSIRQTSWPSGSV